MRRSILILAALFIFGCSTVHTPVVPNALGCIYYCYPTYTDNFVSLTRTNADGTSGAWAGGILSCKGGDHVEATYTTAVCTNAPRPAITFCQYCKSNTMCFSKNIPANGYTMSWDLTNDCGTCTFVANNAVASLCPGGEQRPETRGLWDIVDGKTVSVRKKK